MMNLETKIQIYPENISIETREYISMALKPILTAGIEYKYTSLSLKNAKLAEHPSQII
jgi:glutamine synthetase type III